MNAVSRNNSNAEDSISGQSAELFVTKDDSLASLLLNHGIEVRDFILLSFLSDQGPMSTTQLSRAVGIEPKGVLQCLKRLSAAGLILRDPKPSGSDTETMVRLTGRGQDIASRISAQLG